MINRDCTFKKHGFTLIELLVVIGIISLLSSVAMTNLKSARIKAQEASIKKDLQSIKTQAELSYSKTGNYSNVLADIAPILAHINANGGTYGFYVSNYSLFGDTNINNHYAVAVKFKTDATKNWSISDKTGIAKWDMINEFRSTWASVKTSCEIPVGGISGRLPTVEELGALWSAHGGRPSTFSSRNFWSSSEDATKANIWYMTSYGAISFYSGKTNTNSAHCVY